MNLVIAPDFARGSYISFFRRVNAGQDADAFAMLGILADRDIDPVLVENRRGVDFAGTFRRGVLEFFSLRRIAVIFPNCFQEAGVPFLNWLGIERVAKTVAAAEKNQLAAIDLRQRRGTPLAMENSRPDVRVIFSCQLAGFLVQRNETWRVGRRNIGVGPVLAVGGANIDQVIDDQD